MRDQHGQCCGRTFAACPSAFATDQRVDERTLADTGAAKCRDDQRSFEPNPQRLDSAEQPAQDRSTVTKRLPGRIRIDEISQTTDELVDLRKQFDLCQFRVGHVRIQSLKFLRLPVLEISFLVEVLSNSLKARFQQAHRLTHRLKRF